VGPRLIQCGLGRGLLLYQVASSSIQPFGHNRHEPKTVGCAPFRGELRPHQTQCRLGRPLRRSGRSSPPNVFRFRFSPVKPNLTLILTLTLPSDGVWCWVVNFSRSADVYLRTKWYVDPSSRSATIYMGQKLGGVGVPFSLGLAAFPSNTKWPGPRPTSIPSGTLVHPAVWPQQTLAENWGTVPL